MSGYVPEDLDTLVSTVEAAEAVGVQPTTIRQWKHKRMIAPAGLDKYKRPLYRLLDVMQTEQRTRQAMAARAARSRQPASA